MAVNILRYLLFMIIIVTLTHLFIDHFRPPSGWTDAALIWGVPAGEFIRGLQLTILVGISIGFFIFIGQPWWRRNSGRMFMTSARGVISCLILALMLIFFAFIMYGSIVILDFVTFKPLYDALNYVGTSNQPEEILLGMFTRNDVFRFGESTGLVAICLLVYVCVVLPGAKYIPTGWLPNLPRFPKSQATLPKNLAAAICIGGCLVSMVLPIWLVWLAISSGSDITSSTPSPEGFYFGFTEDEIFGLSELVGTGILALILLTIPYAAFQPLIHGIIGVFGQWPFSSRDTCKFAWLFAAIFVIATYVYAGYARRGFLAQIGLL